MNLIYSIDNSTFAVNIFVSGNNVPVIHQPNWPNGTPWNNYNEADNWAQLCILSINDPEAPYAPAGPGLSGELKII